MIEAAIFVVFPFCMAFAAVSDLLSMTIANRVSLILIGSFAVLAPLTGMDWQTYGMHFAAMGAVLSVTFVLFAVGGMGGGDAKLLASTALWMGLGQPLMTYLVMSAVFGGLLTLAILMFRKSYFAPLAVNNLFLRNIVDKKVGVPYGIALALGGYAAYLEAPLTAWALSRVAGY
jgi:prepilin peptidase CpaA